MLKYIISGIMLALASCTGNPAYAHDWYDPICCNNQDCKPIAAKDIQLTDYGFVIAPRPGLPKGAVIPYNSPKVRRTPREHSTDAPYHICTPFKGQVQCLYIPHSDG